MLGFFLNEKGIKQNSSNNHNRNKVIIRLCITLPVVGVFSKVNLVWGTRLALLWDFFLISWSSAPNNSFLTALSYGQRKESKTNLSRMTSWSKDCEGGRPGCLLETPYRHLLAYVRAPLARVLWRWGFHCLWAPPVPQLLFVEARPRNAMRWQRAEEMNQLTINSALAS